MRYWTHADAKEVVEGIYHSVLSRKEWGPPSFVVESVPTVSPRLAYECDVLLMAIVFQQLVRISADVAERECLPLAFVTCYVDKFPLDLQPSVLSALERASSVVDSLVTDADGCMHSCREWLLVSGYNITNVETLFHITRGWQSTYIQIADLMDYSVANDML